MAETHRIDMQMISESSSVNRGLLLSFMLFEVYILVTVASTTDRMLLVPSTVKLPLANIDIPLFGFFIIAPLFMIALHFNLLVHLQQHTGKVRAFLRQQSGSGRKHDVNLPPFMFNYLQQFRPGHLQHHLLFFVLYVMVVLFPAAVLLYTQFKFSKYHSWAMTGWHYGVLLVELYVIRLYWPRIVHQGEIEDEAETWQEVFEREKRAILRPLLQIIVAALILAGLLVLVHRFSPVWFGSGDGSEFRELIQLLVFLSLAVVVLLRRSRLSESGLLQGLWLLLWQTLLLVPLWQGLWQVVRFLVAPFKYALRKLFKTGNVGPKKSGGRRVGNLQGLLPILLAMAATLNFLFILALPTINRWPRSMLATKGIIKAICPRIVVREQLLVAGQPSDTIIQRYLALGKSDEKDWIKFYEGLILKGRDLQFADLGYSRLFNVVFEKANLQGAKLEGANLQDANLKVANLQGAYLGEANLQGANLVRARLQGAILWRANLQGAVLGFANLQGAHLGRAFIDGTIFFESQLRLTNLQQVSCDLLKIDDWKKLQEDVAKVVPKGRLRDDALERLKDAEKRKKPLFEGGGGIPKEGAFYDPTNACFTDSRPHYKLVVETPQGTHANYIDKYAYQDKLAEYLANLACEDPFIAEGLSRRAASSEDVQLAKALLEKSKACPDMKQVWEDTPEYLADLACEEPSIAEELSRRAAIYVDVQLAKVLLEKLKACPDMKQFQEDTLNRLKELVQENQKTNSK